MIATDLLLAFGAKERIYAKGEIIFSEGENARFYFQMVSGEVKSNNFNDEGKEFTQGIFTAGDSFGEPTLFIDKPYPATAIANSESVILQLAKSSFFEMLHQNPEISIAIATRLANRLYYKAIMASEISSQHPEHRLLKLMDYLKTHVEELQNNQKYEVPLTRQQLADLTGLRVETVIRAVKTLEKKGELYIDHRKIYR